MSTWFLVFFFVLFSLAAATMFAEWMAGRYTIDIRRSMMMGESQPEQEPEQESDRPDPFAPRGPCED